MKTTNKPARRINKLSLKKIIHRIVDIYLDLIKKDLYSSIFLLSEEITISMCHLNSEEDAKRYVIEYKSNIETIRIKYNEIVTEYRRLLSTQKES